MEDEFSAVLALGMVLFWAIIFWIVMWLLVEPVPPRVHLFYCYDKLDDVYFPCRERDNTIIDIRHLPKRIS